MAALLFVSDANENFTTNEEAAGVAFLREMTEQTGGAFFKVPAPNDPDTKLDPKSEATEASYLRRAALWFTQTLCDGYELTLVPATALKKRGRLKIRVTVP